MIEETQTAGVNWTLTLSKLTFRTRNLFIFSSSHFYNFYSFSKYENRLPTYLHDD